VTIRGRLPRYSGPEFEALARSMAHHAFVGPSDPKWNKVKPNFEGVAMNEDPDAHDREKDRRLTGEIP
jgi:hypothetical protein